MKIKNFCGTIDVRRFLTNLGSKPKPSHRNARKQYTDTVTISNSILVYRRSISNR